MVDTNKMSNVMSQSVKIIKPVGILDATKSVDFRQKITEIEDISVKTILIDFQEVTFMDSSGLGALVLAFKTLRAADKKMAICSINEQVRILFELTGMDNVFEIFDSQNDFNVKVEGKVSKYKQI
jgi:anti-sigma B factor antagonist